MNVEAISSTGFIDATWMSPAQAQASSEAFGGLLLEGVKRLDRTMQAGDAAVSSFAVNADVPPHQVMLALEDARLQLQFALQVRSKLIEGYQELMRMQI